MVSSKIIAGSMMFHALALPQHQVLVLMQRQADGAYPAPSAGACAALSDDAYPAPSARVYTAPIRVAKPFLPKNDEQRSELFVRPAPPPPPP